MARPGKLDQDEDQGPGKHVRTTLFQELGEFVLLMGTMATWWQLQIGRAQLQTTLERNRKELNLSREVRVTELFTKAPLINKGTIEHVSYTTWCECLVRTAAEVSGGLAAPG